MQAIQERVALVAAVIDHIGGVKMMGLSDRLARAVQASRVHELAKSASFRRLVTWMNCFGTLISPSMELC